MQTFPSPQHAPLQIVSPTAQQVCAGLSAQTWFAPHIRPPHALLPAATHCCTPPASTQLWVGPTLQQAAPHSCCPGEQHAATNDDAVVAPAAADCWMLVMHALPAGQINPVGPHALAPCFSHLLLMHCAALAQHCPAHSTELGGQHVVLATHCCPAEHTAFKPHNVLPGGKHIPFRHTSPDLQQDAPHNRLALEQQTKTPIAAVTGADCPTGAPVAVLKQSVPGKHTLSPQDLLPGGEQRPAMQVCPLGQQRPLHSGTSLPQHIKPPTHFSFGPQTTAGLSKAAQQHRQDRGQGQGMYTQLGVVRGRQRGCTRSKLDVSAEVELRCDKVCKVPEQNTRQ
jgi:hypothetical protein